MGRAVSRGSSLTLQSSITPFRDAGFGHLVCSLTRFLSGGYTGHRAGEATNVLEMSIESIRVSLMNYQRVVILKQKDAERYLPIWIGPAEADAIAVRLQEVSVPRPLTHDLLRNVIDSLGAQISSIVVNDLAN